VTVTVLPAHPHSDQRTNLQRLQAPLRDGQRHRAGELEAGVLGGAHLLLLLLASDRAGDRPSTGGGARLRPAARARHHGGDDLLAALHERLSAFLDAL
jgi:hypothetical protein